MKKRNLRFMLYLTPEEYKYLCKKSDDTCLSKNEVLRNSLMDATFLVAPPIEYNYFMRELIRVGTNLDQILMVARNVGFFNIKDLNKALSELRSLESEIRNKFNFKFKKVQNGNS